MRLATLVCSFVWLAFIACTAVAQDPGPAEAPEPTTVDAPVNAPPVPPSTDNDLYYARSATPAPGSSGECGKGNGKDGCDCAALAGKVSGAYKVEFFANDFSYLDSPCYDGWHIGDNLKRMRIGKCWTVDVGGQYRMRFHREQNIRNSANVVNGLGLTGNDDDFLLHRTRFYVNAEYGTHFRFYGEMLDADSAFEKNALPRAIEENRSDMQNMFVEFRGFDMGPGTLGARIGRQELLFGAQRLVSPLDWANTRRTFEGARLMWKGENWDVDGIWVRPMRRTAANRTKLDPPNLNRQLYGVYATYKGLCRDNLETYWLAIDYEDFPAGSTGIRYDTIGSRYWGGRGDWLYEFEGGVQFGKNGDATDHSAGFFTAGLGRKFPCRRFKPTVWLWYDWASGDDTVNNGFHHYEPLAHKFQGFMDLYGRRNIHDFNAQLFADLTDKTRLLVWYHYLMLANGNDVPYNITMTPFAGLPAGSSGSRDLGHEIDITITQTLTPRSGVLLGYSHFFAGNYYELTPGVPFDGDADFFYAQWHVNF